MWQLSSSGLIVSGEKETIVGPTQDRRNGTKTAVVYCHGAGGNETAITNAALTGQHKVAKALREHWPIINPVFGGEHWGSPLSVTRAETARSYMQTTLGAKSPKIILVGVSMGALQAMNYLKAYPANVAAVLLFIPMTDQTWIGNSVFVSIRNTAYGTYVAATHDPTSDPSTYVSLLPEVPVRAYYAPNDGLALPSYILNMEAKMPSYKAISVGNLGHSEAAIAAVDVVEMVSWLKSLGL